MPASGASSAERRVEAAARNAACASGAPRAPSRPYLRSAASRAAIASAMTSAGVRREGAPGAWETPRARGGGGGASEPEGPRGRRRRARAEGRRRRGGAGSYPPPRPPPIEREGARGARARGGVRGGREDARRGERIERTTRDATTDDGGMGAQLSKRNASGGPGRVFRFPGTLGKQS